LGEKGYNLTVGNKVLVIIPAYNEENTLGEVIEKIKKNVFSADILVINDGSTDQTGRIAEEKATYVLNLPYNLGIGGAMQTGFKFAEELNYEIAVRVDADGQHNPQEINNLLKPILDNKADLVIGSRFLSILRPPRFASQSEAGGTAEDGETGGYRSSFFRRLGIQFFSFLVSLFINEKVKDPTSGFRAMNKKVVRFYAQEYPVDYPEVEELLLLKQKGLNFLEISVKMLARKSGQSSITWFKSLYYMIKVSLALFITLFKKKDEKSRWV